MAKKVWHVEIGGKPHVIEVLFSRLIGGGKVFVDGKLIDVWSPGLLQGPAIRRFKLDGRDVILEGTTLSYVLYVDGEKIEPKKKNIIA